MNWMEESGLSQTGYTLNKLVPKIKRAKNKTCRLKLQCVFLFNVLGSVFYRSLLMNHWCFNDIFLFRHLIRVGVCTVFFFFFKQHM